MKTIKIINGEILGIDKLNNLFRLNGNGIWVQFNNNELFEIL